MKKSSSLIVACLITSCVFPLAGQLYQQTQTVDRDEYFRRMEQRAISLSRKIAEISGTEPVQVITPREEPKIVVPPPTTYSAQQYFDALPGLEPKETNSSLLPVPSKIEMNSSRPEMVDDEYFDGMRPTTEEIKGAFFLRPFLGLQTTRDPKLIIGSLNSKVESSMGYGLGLSGGRRIDNLLLSLKMGYFYNEVSKEDFGGYGLFSLNGENELFSLVASIGYSVPVNDSFTFEVAGGIGFGNRSSTYWTDSTFIPLTNFDNTVFSYELSMLLDYSYSEFISLFLGYRLIGASDNDAFDRMTSHLFEVGLGANF